MEPGWSRFTAAEGGARLAATASERNTLVVEHASFIATRLIHEHGFMIRGLLSSGKKRSVYISRSSRVACAAYDLRILTDLAVAQAESFQDVQDWRELLEIQEVLVCTSSVLRQILVEGILSMPNINVLVVDSCHLIHEDEDLQLIMQLYKECPEAAQPRILALTYPLFSSTKKTDDEQTESDIGSYENLDDFEMYAKLEWKIDELEKALCCRIDLAEDIDGGKRFSATVMKPKELIVEYKPTRVDSNEDYNTLENFMRDTIRDAEEFLEEHRYDPSEIYGEDMYEEFMNIPNPTIEPKNIFKQFKYVLNELGPYGADKAAFSLLTNLEKLKIKVPYERHFLLLCLCTTVFVKIRCYADSIFTKYGESERIRIFSTPKVLRFIEILAQFQVKKEESKVIEEVDVKNDAKAVDKMLLDIDKCDFATLGDKIEDRINTYEANLKEILIDDAREMNGRPEPGETNEVIEKQPNIITVNHFNDIQKTSDAVENTNSDEIDNPKDENEKNNVENCTNEKIDGNKDLIQNEVTDSQTELTDVDSQMTADQIEKQVDLKSDPERTFGFRRSRLRGRGRAPRNANRGQQALQNPDALCGIVFIKEPLMAKIMFLLVVDLSRSDPELSHVCAQYCAADEPSEWKHCRAREDALKKFRMHDCNLLLATAALEEGIDLPRCNLVLRWDIPASYRSHGLCRGRARAPRAACVLLCRATGHAGDAEDAGNAGDAVEAGVAVDAGDAGDAVEAGDAVDAVDAGDAAEGAADAAEDAGDAAENTGDVAKDAGDAAEDVAQRLLHHVATYKELDQIISRKCGCGVQDEPPQDEEDHADSFTPIVKPYTPLDSDKTCQTCRDKRDCPTCLDKIENETLKNPKSIETCKNNISELNKINDDLSKINLTDDLTDKSVNSDVNLICNKCNKQRVSGGVECACTSKIDEKIEYKVKKDGECASVDLASAISLINRYCGKLPSDTFTRLTPAWQTERVRIPGLPGVPGVPDVPGVPGVPDANAYVCTLRLPLNCPVKYNIVGHPMPTRVLARRVAALQACRILHRSGELDDNLMPIGKENFKAAELEGGNFPDEEPADARPGTTKRRQYYYKRTAAAFTDCQPVVDATDEEIASDPEGRNIPKDKPPRNVLHAIDCTLWCALPERYNTRGRRLHAPQHARQAIALLLRARDEPGADKLQIPSFPVYTRSGEVRVRVSRAPRADTRLSPSRARLVRRFMRFVFAEVLRVRRRGMTLHSEGSTHNNYYIVPTVKVSKPDGSTIIEIDWQFLEQIYQYTEEKKHSELEKPILWHQDEEEIESSANGDKVDTPVGKDKVKKTENPLLKPGEVFVFDAEKYKEAVVTPWYRNQDQPQFFLVAEICWNLTPDSAFPSATHTSFRHYYNSKYGVTLTQPDQPLLDVDHTSARLNLLTPRYVNRKGVALPVSSERTRRAKRDRLDQKQILVPELCRVHPFAAPLWFATVALPAVLYRINALLIADEIRRSVARDVALGLPKIHAAGDWPPLDFGWSLAEVLSADLEKNDKKKEEIEQTEDNEQKSRVADQQESENVKEGDGEQKEKTVNDILQEKEDAESGFEIGMWDNDMAASIPQTDYDEFMEPLPPNLTFCTSASGGANWCEPVQKPKSQFNPSRTFSMADSDCSYMSSDFDTDDSDLNSESSDDTETSGFCSSKSNAAMGVRIEYKTAHEAEAVDLERPQPAAPAPAPHPAADRRDRDRHRAYITHGHVPRQYLEKFQKSVEEHKRDIIEKGLLIKEDCPVAELLPECHKEARTPQNLTGDELDEKLKRLFPYDNEFLKLENGQITLENIEKSKRYLLNEFKKTLTEEEIREFNCFSMKDVDIDSPGYVNEKIENIGFDKKESYEEKVRNFDPKDFVPYFDDNKGQNGKGFDFDYQPKLEGHPGPSPSVILQALTMSNANDGINLERLETIGDSFLKFAITAYLYCAHPTVHEGKLSHMRSKQVSNLNLYRLGVRKRLGARMIASKFEPHDNWLPPCHRAPPTDHPQVESEDAANQQAKQNTGCFIPYNLITQHSIPDKSIADCVEALIGAYLLETGPRGALVFMSWLGIRVLPRHRVPVPPPTTPPTPPTQRGDDGRRVSERPRQSDSESESESDRGATDEPPRPVGSLRPTRGPDGQWTMTIFGELKAPPSPLLRYIEDPEGELEQMLSGYDALERTLQYRFRDRSLLLQALTHASHRRNRLTDCYQRLEFLGDAILDYLITRHLYEDGRRHSPGALTDLRSALVNNTIFATLAARHGFHKYFRHMSPGLNEVLTKYVKIQEENGHSISEEHYLIHEDEMEQAEDVEVPKALGDLFESVAGAIFLDSGMSLGAVWKSYELLMGAELEAFSAAAPKSPVRELLEAEPDTAKFGKPERLADGRRVRVCVEVFGRGAFKGVGRNYRIAKGTAARCALRHLKRHRPH